MPSSPIDALARHREDVVPPCPPEELPDLPALAALLDALPDPRHRYRLGPLLALCLLAVLGGATSLARITRFIAGCDPELLTAVGLRPGADLPAASTIGDCSPAWTQTLWTTRRAATSPA